MKSADNLFDKHRDKVDFDKSVMRASKELGITTLSCISTGLALISLVEPL